MKKFTEYITESQKAENWMKCVKQMYKWYCDNYGTFYDNSHHYSKKNHKRCELIDDKSTIADCSGFVGACLCLAGYTDNPLLFNVRLGSFNLRKNTNLINNIDLSAFDSKHKEKIKYIADIPDFECIKLNDDNKKKLKGVKAGDILVKGSHVTIVADDEVSSLYDWGSESVNKHDSYNPVKFYVPKDKNITFPYRSLWRIK